MTNTLRLVAFPDANGEVRNLWLFEGAHFLRGLRETIPPGLNIRDESLIEFLNSAVVGEGLVAIPILGVSNEFTLQPIRHHRVN